MKACSTRRWPTARLPDRHRFQGRPSADQPEGQRRGVRRRQLCYWSAAIARRKRLGENPNVVVYYRNAARKENPYRAGCIRFHGKARLVTSGPERDKVWDLTNHEEQSKDPDKKGAAVIMTRSDRADRQHRHHEEADDLSSPWPRIAWRLRRRPFTGASSTPSWRRSSPSIPATLSRSRRCRARRLAAEAGLGPDRAAGAAGDP